MTLKVIRLNEITNRVSVDRGEKNPQEIAGQNFKVKEMKGRRTIKKASMS